MKAQGGVDVYVAPPFLTLVSLTPRPLNPRKRAPGTHCIGGWVGLRAGVDDVEGRKIFCPVPGRELRHLSPPARSQSMYRLSYPGYIKNYLGGPEEEIRKPQVSTDA
jgi:hypothetical protein